MLGFFLLWDFLIPFVLCIACYFIGRRHGYRRGWNDCLNWKGGV